MLCVSSVLAEQAGGISIGAMSFKEQFPDWEDFPSGLRVLVVENGEEAAASVGRLLEECDFHGELIGVCWHDLFCRYHCFNFPRLLSSICRVRG